MDQLRVGGRELDAVVSGLAGPRRRARGGLHELVDILRGEDLDRYPPERRADVDGVLGHRDDRPHPPPGGLAIKT